MPEWLTEFLQNRESRIRNQKLQKLEKKLRKLEEKNESEKERQESRIGLLNSQKDTLIFHNAEVQKTMMAEKWKMLRWIHKDFDAFRKDKKRTKQEQKIRNELQGRLVKYTNAFDRSTWEMSRVTGEVGKECSNEESEELRKKIIICWRVQTSSYHAILIYSKELRAKELKEKIEEHEDRVFSRDWEEFEREFPEVNKSSFN